MSSLNQIISAFKPGKNTSVVNITNQHYFCFSIFCHTHIDNIGCLQINFRGTTSAFHHDPVCFSFQRIKGLFCNPKIFFGHCVIFTAGAGTHDLTHTDQLRFAGTLRLEQNRIHPHIRKHSAGFRLNKLSTSHFQSLRSYPGIKRHILRFKRQNTKTAVFQQTTKSSRQNTFTNSGTGALKH